MYIPLYFSNVHTSIYRYIFFFFFPPSVHLWKCLRMPKFLTILKREKKNPMHIQAAHEWSIHNNRSEENNLPLQYLLQSGLFPPWDICDKCPQKKKLLEGPTDDSKWRAVRAKLPGKSTRMDLFASFFFFLVTFSVHRTTENGRQMQVWDTLAGLPWWKERLNAEGRWSQTGNRLVRVCRRYCSQVCSNAEDGSDGRGAMKGNGGRALGRSRWSLMEGVCDPHTWMGFSYWGVALSPFPRPRILTTRPLLLHSARKEGQQCNAQTFLYKWDKNNDDGT